MIITSSLSSDSCDVLHNPELLNKAKFYSRAYLLAILYVVKKTKRQNVNLCFCRDWMANFISKNCLFVEIIEDLESSVFHEIDKCLQEFNFKEIPDLGSINELALTIDVKNTSSDFDKSNRNRQGSYYSPITLVSWLVKKSIDHYVEMNGRNKLLHAKIVDVSCGDGIFLVSSVKYILEVLNDFSKGTIQQIISNIYACDVDCLALEIAKLNLIELMGDEKSSLYGIVSDHFVHGNFLLSTNSPLGTSSKIDLYSKGFIYECGLSIGINFLQQYDIILGNPPWEKIRFEEVPYYAQFFENPSVLNYKDDRTKIIDEIVSKYPLVYSFARHVADSIEISKVAIKKDSRFVDSAVGELNTCTLFIDACKQLLSCNGVMGLIIKSSSLTSKVNQRLFSKLRSNIVKLVDFINTKKYFDIDGRERFSLLLVDNRVHDSFKVSMNVTDVKDAEKKYISIGINNLRLLNPETGMLPNLTDSSSLRVLLSIYKQNNTIGDIYKNVKFGRLVHLTNHSKFIDRMKKSNNLPIYEGKFFSVLNGRYSGFNSVEYSSRYKNKAHSLPLSLNQLSHGDMPESRFFIHEDKWLALSKNYKANYMLAWHSLTSATNERACVSTLLPFVPGAQSIQFLVSEDQDTLAFLTGLFSSVAFDFVVKNKITGIDLTQSIINQIAAPNLVVAKGVFITFDGIKSSAFDWIVSIVAALLKDDSRLIGFFNHYKINDKLIAFSRHYLIMLMDVIYAHLYKLSKPDFAYILSKYSAQYSKNDVIIALNLFDSVLNQ